MDRVERLGLKAGETAAAVEDGFIRTSTSGVWRFRQRHPIVYGLLAFVLGGGFIAVFTMTTYSNWAYDGVDLKAAVYQIVFGGLGAGIISVVLAFAYTAAVGSLRR
jgi:hypothetical protein